METLTIVLAVALLVAVGMIIWLLLGRSRVVATIERARAEAIQAVRETEIAEQRRTEDTAKLEGVQKALRGELNEMESRARSLELDPDEEEPLIKNLGLLSRKPIIYATNVSEDDLAEGNDWLRQTPALAREEDASATSPAAVAKEFAA